VRHRDADAAEELYPLGDGVDQFHLLIEVLVESKWIRQKNLWVSSGSGSLPSE
jgi:hypothetical protein